MATFCNNRLHQRVSLHIETRKCYVQVKCVLELDKSDVFQISNIVGQTLFLNLLHVHEF